MSDTENNGVPAEHPTGDLPPGNPDEPTTPYEAQPAAPAPAEAPQPPAYGSPLYGSTSAYGAPPAYGEPAYTPPPTYGAPAPGVQPPNPYAVTPQAAPGRPSGWIWPIVAAIALVVGLIGGAIGGSLVDNGNNNSSTSTPDVGILKLQQQSAPPLAANNASIPAVAAKVLPSTVQIVAEYDHRAQGATGSGFVLDRAGHVITNNHVVEQAAADNGPIDVIDQSGRHMKATVVGRSTVYDIAVLKVDGAQDLPPVSIGSANQMRVGETVVAFGSPLGLSATVTSGIISAKRRPVTTGDGSDASYISAVQTDAAINPGNSGGPLVDLQGQVIGVNSAIATVGSSSSGSQSANIGVSFAIPIEQVLVTANQILRTGKAEYPVMGVTVRGNAAGTGAVVRSITVGTPAASANLRVGDLITKVDGLPVTGSIDVVVAVRTHQPGEKATLTIQRGGKTFDVSIGLIGKTG
ncbi:MAG: peptidase and chymotrypsin/Hap [Marmoricola sp.]|nr:peptidase and chymotrypsin/Hap [Marmoricola sp.]